jgi:hypothetical protein
MVILVYVLSILGDTRGIKCTCNTAIRAAFTGKMMNSDQATRRLVSPFFLTPKRRRFGLKLGIFADFQFNPPAFNRIPN